jgi:hypothetical protein
MRFICEIKHKEKGTYKLLGRCKQEFDSFESLYAHMQEIKQRDNRTLQMEPPSHPKHAATISIRDEH